jgi:hypothetical protein
VCFVPIMGGGACEQGQSLCRARELLEEGTVAARRRDAAYAHSIHSQEG